MQFPRLSITFIALSLLSAPSSVSAQNFVEYPGHNQTYGSHSVPATWTGGPTGLTVTMISDGTMHVDGNGFSQRTARNTLNFTPPSSIDNPQNYDNLSLIEVYGTRFPQLQQMSASGTSTLVYDFDTPVNEALDLFVTDIDQRDSAVVRAFDAQGNVADLTSWIIAGQGDLSTYKNTGTMASDIVAPNATLDLSTNEIALFTTDATNYNRCYTILRKPAGQLIDRIEITFTGTNNSADREAGGTGSHIYIALTTARFVTQLSPVSYFVAQGVRASGGPADLAESDDSDLSARRSNTSIESVVEVRFTTETSTTDFDTLEFAFEGSVFARTGVTQTISLFDFEVDEWVEFDSRAASRFVDSTTSISPDGDVTRFVNPNNSRMLARVEYMGLSQRSLFTANIDLASWLIIGD